MTSEKDFHFTGYQRDHLEAARNLRKNMTKQEKRLWYSFLKGYPVKVYRQRSIDHFIVDFYCSQAKLVIELDGSQHYTQDGHKYDDARTQILTLYGLEVMRFSNADVDERFEMVCDKIKERIHDRMEAE